MNKEYLEYAELLKEDIKLLGYEALRYSLFEGEQENRQEYQVRIDYEKTKNVFIVYTTNERVSVMGKYEFQDFFAASEMFLSLIQSRVIENRRRVKEKEKPEYQCSLWNAQ